MKQVTLCIYLRQSLSGHNEASDRGLLHAGRNVARSPMQTNLTFLQAEESNAFRTSKAWDELRKLESYFPKVVVEAQLSEEYLSSRPQCLALAKQLAGASALSEGVALDAILMLDRLLCHQGELFSQVCIASHASCSILSFWFAYAHTCTSAS